MSVPQIPSRQQERRRRRSGWKVVLAVLLIALVAILALLVYAGLVPGLSGLVGANTPRDLGVHATPADYDRVVQNISTMVKPAPAAGGARTPQKFDHEFTEAELSALLAHSSDSAWPVRSAQVRVHADGTLEASLGLSKEAIPPEVLQRLPRVTLPSEVPVYVKGRLSIAGPNELRLDAQHAEVGRFPLPVSLFAPGGALSFSDLLNDELRSTPGLVLQNLTYQEGRVRIQGTYQP
ncbi:MAG TPA: hypothetical protein VNT75_13890 [Symbiobacteriaceae bacterium]|nr:hypothetical protein [Symbiobacteriaceae bacterium]